MNIIPHFSPNFNERQGHTTPQLIILHYTDMLDALSALERLCAPATQVSAHYLISKGGEIYQMVPDSMRAWHAGQSYWQGETDINSASIGIELDNPGHSYGLEPYPQVQLGALLDLLKSLRQRYNIPRSHIIGHSDIAPLRKRDPGEHFPWEWLRQHQLGHEIAPTPIRATAKNISEIQQQLQLIGYHCPNSGELDELTEAVLMAFTRHFIPDRLSTAISPQLLDILSRVNTA